MYRILNSKKYARQIFLSNNGISISFCERHSTYVKTIASTSNTLSIIAEIPHPHTDFTIIGKAIMINGVVKSAANPTAFDLEKPIILKTNKLVIVKKKGNNKKIASKYFIS